MIYESELEYFNTKGKCVAVKCLYVIAKDEDEARELASKHIENEIPYWRHSYDRVEISNIIKATEEGIIKRLNTDDY